MVATTARFAPNTLTSLVDLSPARRESVARSADALRIEAADAISHPKPDLTASFVDLTASEAARFTELL